MNVEEAIQHIKACARQMNDRYGSVVFDEWAVISLARDKARILAYIGPRNDAFLKNFANDLGSLRTELHDSKYSTGDFEFARHGVGTTYEAFMVLGDGAYLICNNTSASMTDITKNSKWLNAQVPFAELSDKIRSNPVTPVL
ncbi:MAG TPA: hypothetical protein PKA41_13020 [Verrucomicrobiota bacterium]|nr:hypothetical protein [Verrucomicrobiota bacterium]